MSKYKEILTEFRSLNSLTKALNDLGFTDQMIEITPELRVPTLPLYGYQNDIRPERASVRIHRSNVGRAANDVGFAWDGSCYKAIISFPRHNDLRCDGLPHALRAFWSGICQGGTRSVRNQAETVRQLRTGLRALQDWQYQTMEDVKVRN